MTQFPSRSTLPLSARNYLAAAVRLERYARQLRERSAPTTPREQASLTSAIHGLSLYAQDLSRRHRRALSDR